MRPTAVGRRLLLRAVSVLADCSSSTCAVSRPACTPATAPKLPLGPAAAVHTAWPPSTRPAAARLTPQHRAAATSAPDDAPTGGAGVGQSLAELLYKFNPKADDAEALEAQLLPLVDQATPEELVSGAGAAAIAGFRRPALLEALARALERTMRDLTPPQLAAAAMAMAELRYWDVDFKDALADAVVARLGEFEPHMLARCVGTFGQQHYYDDELLESVGDHCAAALEGFDPGDVASILCAFSAVGYYHPELMDEVERWLDGRDVKPQELVVLVDALSRIGSRCGAAIASAADFVEANTSAFEPRQLPTLASAFARAGYADDSLFAAMAPIAVQALDSYTAKEVTKLVCAYGDVRNCQPQLFDRVSDEIIPSRMDEFTTSGISSILRAFARVGYTNVALAERLSARIGTQHFSAADAYEE